MAVEVGSRWVYRGRVVTIQQRVDSHPMRGPGVHVLAVPERTEAQRKAAKIRKGGHHWTDWVPEKTLENRGEYVPPGEEPVLDNPRLPKTPKEAAASAAGVARKKKVRTLDTGQRLKNRINSARYKLRHPEKNGRKAWTPLEKAEIEAVIASAEADLLASKGGK